MLLHRFRDWLIILMVLAVVPPAQAAGKKYALLVGVSEYDSATFTPLKYTENDAEELAKVLKDAGYDEVVLLTSSRGKKDKAHLPTAANIRARLKSLSDNVKRDDLLLIGLAGHGVQWQVVDEKTRKTTPESFFCPSDARPRSEQTLDELKKTMIPLGELFRVLEESGAGVRLMLVDACRNEIKAESRNVDIDSLPRTKKGTAVLFSCKAGERAFESGKLGKGHGVFFYHVIEGMKGKASNDKGEVIWSRLADYVIGQVSDDVPSLIGSGARQTPHRMENIEGRSPLLARARKTTPSDAGGAQYREALGLYSGRDKVIDRERGLKRFREAAEQGHLLASGYAGWMLMRGLGSERNTEAGKRLIERALPDVSRQAEEGDADAQVLYGRLLFNGWGVPRDGKAAADWIRKAANKGHGGAMHELGMMLRAGRDVEKDETEGLRWLHKGAESGEVAAMMALAYHYDRSKSSTPDLKEAVKWYRKAADKGDASAMNILGVCYNAGRGVEKNEKEAVAWYRKAAEKGLSGSMANLAMMYASGRGVEKDEKEATRWYRKAAEQGFTPSMVDLASRYLSGRGVEKDEKEALAWYKKAADKGDLVAVTRLAAISFYGRGVPKDEAEGLRLYRQAADKGYAPAISSLAWNYKMGRGVEKDEKEAVRLFRQAADKGHLRSMVDLGQMLSDGQGMARDDKEAVAWFRKAAEKDEVGGYYHLGQAYRTGQGVPKDPKEAAAWFRKAGERGNARANFALGEMLARGEGIPKDRTEALECLKKALKGGVRDARALIDELERNK